MIRVEGSGLSLRHRGRHDSPPMFVMKTFAFEVDLGTLFTNAKRVHSVTIDGMEINIPPKGERPNSQSGTNMSSCQNRGLLARIIHGHQREKATGPLQVC